MNETSTTTRYFYMAGGERRGPFTLEELLQQPVQRRTPVWTKGMADWAAAHDVPELAGLLPPPAPSGVPAEPNSPCSLNDAIGRNVRLTADPAESPPPLPPTGRSTTRRDSGGFPSTSAPMPTPAIDMLPQTLLAGGIGAVGGGACGPIVTLLAIWIIGLTVGRGGYTELAVWFIALAPPACLTADAPGREKAFLGFLTGICGLALIRLYFAYHERLKAGHEAASAYAGTNPVADYTAYAPWAAILIWGVTGAFGGVRFLKTLRQA